MKVLSYLEWKSSDYYSYNNYEISMHLIPNYCEHDCEPDLFYSQPFKPELITELFEGWEIYPNNFSEQWYKNNKKFIMFENYRYFIEQMENAKQNRFTPPRTLDDFITDCQRAGIELEWRKI